MTIQDIVKEVKSLKKDLYIDKINSVNRVYISIYDPEHDRMRLEEVTNVNIEYNSNYNVCKIILES